MYIEDLSVAKKIPVKFLSSLGVRNCPKGIAIDYKLENGDMALRQRLRISISSKDGFRWNKGEGEPVPYGLWRLEIAKKEKYLILVEGESDCWTLWYHGFPALGLPGANMMKLLRSQYLDGIENIYVWKEPDQGGNAFCKDISKIVYELKWHGNVRIIENSGYKDPNALHLANNKNFKKIFRYLLLASSWMIKYIPSEPKKISRISELVGTGKIKNAAKFPVWKLLEKKPGSKVLCLWHKDQKHPSVHLYDDGHFYCFTCGKRGNAIDWIRQTNGYSFIQAVEALQ